MCGVVGYVELNKRSSCTNYLDDAIQSLTHRGPDSSEKRSFT